MRAALECIPKFPGSCCAQMNSSVRTCAGLFITQHLKVSYFLSDSSRADAHDELSKTGGKKYNWPSVFSLPQRCFSRHSFLIKRLPLFHLHCLARGWKIRQSWGGFSPFHPVVTNLGEFSVPFVTSAGAVFWSVFAHFFLQSGASSNKGRHALSSSVGRMLASGKQHSLNRYRSTASRWK